jgi:probable phosphoglycerate mutase
MAIYIVRHGETAGNAGGVVQFPDTPLNERGLAQAEAVGARLSDVGITRILASDYARAYSTAQGISKTTGLELEIIEGLRERNFGDLRGRPRAEVGEQMQDETFAPPNGESWPVFHDRVARCWAEVAKVAAQTQGHLAVVTHGLVCHSLVLKQLSLPQGMEPITSFGNTSVTITDPSAPFTVSLLNCTTHLDENIGARGSVL